MNIPVLEPRPCEAFEALRWWPLAAALLFRSPRSLACIVAACAGLEWLDGRLLNSADDAVVVTAGLFLGLLTGAAVSLFAARWWSLHDGAVSSVNPVQHLFRAWRDVLNYGFAVFLSVTVMVIATSRVKMPGADTAVHALFPVDPPKGASQPMMVFLGGLSLVCIPTMLAFSTAAILDIPLWQALKLQFRRWTQTPQLVSLIHLGAWILPWIAVLVLIAWLELIVGYQIVVVLTIRSLVIVLASAWLYVAVRDIYLGRRENKPDAIRMSSLGDVKPRLVSAPTSARCRAD